MAEEDINSGENLEAQEDSADSTEALDPKEANSGENLLEVLGPSEL